MAKSLHGRGHPLRVIPDQRLALEPQKGPAAPISFEAMLARTGCAPFLGRSLETLQLNLGKLCNQTCRHCHVDAGPDRRELMSWETMSACLAVLDDPRNGIRCADLTGGAPELNPRFRDLVTALRDGDVRREQPLRILDRCNLTVLNTPRCADLPEFLAQCRVEIVASLPCYLESNTDAQRGDGVFADSLKALRRLNALGYGRPGTGLELTLVYNPLGPSLPPDQSALEGTYRRELFQRYGVVFNKLFTIANVPINRFLADLRERGEYEAYLEMLVGAFNPETVLHVMCRSMISVGWDGALYDCDFNQMLELGLEAGCPQTIGDWDGLRLKNRTIRSGWHCYACTAGAGSGCGGAVLADGRDGP